MRKRYFAFLLMTLQGLSLDAQSGWTRNKGGIYVKMGVATSSSKNYYDTDGILNKNVRTFYQQMLTFYGEYGITKNITAIINYPYLKFQHYQDFKPVSGISNPKIELKLAVWKKIPVVSFSIGAEIPVAKQVNISVANFETAPRVRESVNLPVGYADFNYWGTLAISSGLGNTPGWLSIFGQYILRGKNYSNQAKLGFELGYKWTPKLWTNIRLIGFYQTPRLNNIAGNITNGEGTEHTTFAFGAAYEFVKHWSITADFQAYNDFLVRLKNVYAAPFYQIGISSEF